MCEGQSEQENLLEARGEVVVVFQALQGPAAAVVTVADKMVGLPDVWRWVLWCEAREQKVRLLAVLGVCLCD